MTAFAVILLGMFILVNGSPLDPAPGNVESVNVENPPKIDSPTVEVDNPLKVEGENPLRVEGENPLKVEEENPLKVEEENPPNVDKPSYNEPGVKEADVIHISQELSSFQGRAEILGSSWDANAKSLISEATVTCFEKRGLAISIQFTKDFHGHVYPEGGWGTCESLTFHGTGNPTVQLLLQAGSLDCDHVIHRHVTTFAHLRLRIQWDPTFVTKDDHVMEITCDDPANGAFPDYGVQMRLTDIKSGKQLNRTFPGVKASLDVILENADGRDVAVAWCVAQDDNMGHLEVLKNNCPAKDLPGNPFSVPNTVSNGKSSKTLSFHFDTFGLPTRDYVIIECDIEICEGTCVTRSCEDSEQSAGVSQVTKSVTLFQFYSIVLPTVYLEHSTACPEPILCPYPSQAGTEAGFIGLGVAITIVSYFVFMRCKADVKNAKLRDKEKRSYSLPYLDDVPLHDMHPSASEGGHGSRQDLTDVRHN